MARRKSNLALHRQKRKHKTYPVKRFHYDEVFSTKPSSLKKRKFSPRKSPFAQSYRSPLYKRFKQRLTPKPTPKSNSGKRKLSPLHSSLGSPLYIAKRLPQRVLFESDDQHESDWFHEISSQLDNHVNNIAVNESVTNESIIEQSKSELFENSTGSEADPNRADSELNQIVNELKKLVGPVVEKLAQHPADHHLVLLSFFRQINCDKFPLNNIALLLWGDVVRWFDKESTKGMRYCDDTKLFWKMGWRLFGGRFVNFMAGFKNQSEYSHDTTTCSKYSPSAARLNFAVPDRKVLNTFDPYDCESQRSPGIYDDVITTLSQNMGHVSGCLTFDGKKLKQGLSEHYGDVDLIGFEKGLTLIEKRSQLQKVTSELTSFINKIQSRFDNQTPLVDLPEDMKAQIRHLLLDTLKTVSVGKHEMEETKKKKEYAKERLIERGGDSNWRNGKFSYAISAMMAYVYDINQFIQNSEKVIRELCMYISKVNNCPYTDDMNVDLESDDRFNPIEKLMDIDGADDSNPRLIKQRSDEWFEIRSTVKITGSNLNKGLGLEGLKYQKDYFETTFCGVPERPKSDFVKQAIKHGIDNEVNAVATLVGKIIPVLYPNLVFCEEGCVMFYNETLKPFLVVSPDGSLRKDRSMASTEIAVEIKCPVRGVHFEFPSRYVLQCLAEMEALDVDKLLYLSWTESFTSVFELERNTPMFTKVMQMAKHLFDSDKIVVPKKVTDTVKSVKEEVKAYCSTIPFIGLFPSAKSGKSHKTQNDEVKTIGNLASTIHTVVDIHQNRYELNREKASESVVFICSDLNRNWDKTVSRTGAVAWFTKGYSLDTETMRKIAEEVHNRCHNAGIHVPCESFDGQWHNLVTRTESNQPLTILQLQKDVWKEVEQTKKHSLISRLCEMNKTPMWRFTKQPENDKTVIDVTNYIKEVPQIKHSILKEKPKPPKKSNADNSETNVVDKTIINTSNDPLKQLSRELQLNNIPAAYDQNEQEISQIIVTDEDLNCLLALLKTDNASNNKGQWDNQQINGLKEKLSSPNQLKTLRDIEIKVVARYFKKTKSIRINESARKQAKVDVLSKYLGHTCETGTNKVTMKTVFSVKSLRELSVKVVSNMSKQVLNCVLAEILWPEKYDDWKLQTHVSQNVYIDGIDVAREWFYQPEYSTKRNQLEVKCIDATHLLTRTRRKCCKGGLDGIKNDAWKAVAKTGNTLLTPIMVEEITDPMSSAMAATHFSEDVEAEMRKLGYTNAAKLCRDVRMWWEAEDCSGFPALERFKMRENLRQRLLSHVQFNKFPPPTKYVAGWPLQLWEALIAHIDAKTLLYSLCHNGTYNVRAFSSLVGETFFSELVLHDKTGCGTVTAAEFGRFIGAASEQLHVRHDPNKKFVYRTGRSHVYKLSGSDVTTSDSAIDNNVCSACLPLSHISKITLKNQEFDQPQATTSKRKLETVSTNRNAIQKGTLGVRYEYARRNDSKMLLTS